MKKNLLIFISLITLFSLFPPKTYAQISPKKGVAGGTSLENLNKLNSSWFYNWAYIPAYKTANNWDPTVWQKFVPLFYASSADFASGTATPKIVNEMGLICRNTTHCNGGYYLVGNEPLVLGQDLPSAMTDRDAAYYFVQKYGKIIKEIKRQDPQAKIILLGMDNIEYDTVRKNNFAGLFIQKWREYWWDSPATKDDSIKDLSLLIKGWHVHTYGTYNNYDYCPTNDNVISGFLSAVNLTMERSFGRRVPNQELWVTEMGTLDGLPDFTLPGDETRRQQFARRMECLVNVYENSPLVTRYAWFYYGCSSTFHSYCSSPTGKYNLFLPSTTDPSGFSLTYLGTKYRTLGVIPPVIGDVNGDRHVNLQDYTVFVSCYGITNNPNCSVCDFNNSGGIGIDDYSLLIANYGR